MDPDSGFEQSLSNPEISRYSRQLLLSEIGAEGQRKLLNAKILVVGAGGLGCPCAIYLAASGVGHIGIVDDDVIEISNLHRQIAHTEKRIGTSKAESLKTAILERNSSISCEALSARLKPENVMTIVRNYDVVCDCTDNMPTRYLINDACVLADKPLVSGSALRWEGQLTVYHYHDNPCYRCLFPEPPDQKFVGSCAQNGVIGVVPGVIGTMEALEAIKIVLDVADVSHRSFTLFDGLALKFHKVKLRARHPDCAVCGQNPTITQLANYEELCKAPACDQVQVIRLLPMTSRTSIECYAANVRKLLPHVLVDCRPKHEFEICHLKNSINIPLKEMQEKSAEELSNLIGIGGPKDVFVICHRGNLSQLGVSVLRDKFAVLPEWKFFDIAEGLDGWAEKIDPTFPRY